MLSHNDATKRVELVTDRDYKVGDPVYAWCGPQPNSRLLINYVSGGELLSRGPTAAAGDGSFGRQSSTAVFLLLDAATLPAQETDHLLDSTTTTTTTTTRASWTRPTPLTSCS